METAAVAKCLGEPAAADAAADTDAATAAATAASATAAAATAAAADHKCCRISLFSNVDIFNHNELISNVVGFDLNCHSPLHYFKHSSYPRRTSWLLCWDL